MGLRYITKKISSQITIPENLDNNKNPKRDINGLICMGSRKRQDHLSKLGAWGPWEKFEGEGKEEEGIREIKLNKII